VIPRAWRRLPRVPQAAFERVDIVVSNAAIGVLRPALELTQKHWRRCLETNALAFNTLAQQCVPIMPRGGA
jgi:enoyl-[acyl-carrier protein] reductase III